MTEQMSDAALLYKAWACLTGADSVLSLIFHRYHSMLPEDVQRDVEASYRECRKAAEAIKPRADELCHAKITHGRHCTCSACAREDWTNPDLAPCGMHGSSCPREYQPWGLAGTRDWVADSSYGRLNAAGSTTAQTPPEPESWAVGESQTEPVSPSDQSHGDTAP